MNTQSFRNVFALPALITVGLLGNQAPATAQPMALQHPVGSWLYTVTIPVDDEPAHNIVFQGLETYIMDGGYIETDQLSFSPPPWAFPHPRMDPGRVLAVRIF